MLNVWAHRGNAEKYFKYRYSDFNYPIGSLTEYFKFADPDETQFVGRDLYEMEVKALSPVEQDILAEKQDEFLAALLADGQMKAGDIRVSDSAWRSAGSNRNSQRQERSLILANAVITLFNHSGLHKINQDLNKLVM